MTNTYNSIAKTHADVCESLHGIPQSKGQTGGVTTVSNQAVICLHIVQISTVSQASTNVDTTVENAYTVKLA